MPVRNYRAFVENSNASLSRTVSRLSDEVYHSTSRGGDDVRRELQQLLKDAENYEAAERRGEWWTRYHYGPNRREIERLLAAANRLR